VWREGVDSAGPAAVKSLLARAPLPRVSASNTRIVGALGKSLASAAAAHRSAFRPKTLVQERPDLRTSRAAAAGRPSCRSWRPWPGAERRDRYGRQVERTHAQLASFLAERRPVHHSGQVGRGPSRPEELKLGGGDLSGSLAEFAPGLWRGLSITKSYRQCEQSNLALQVWCATSVADLNQNVASGIARSGRNPCGRIVLLPLRTNQGSREVRPLSCSSDQPTEVGLGPQPCPAQVAGRIVDQASFDSATSAPVPRDSTGNTEPGCDAGDPRQDDHVIRHSRRTEPTSRST